MPDPTPTPTEQVDNALKLARDAQALLDRAKELGTPLPPEFEDKANALLTLDAPKTSNIAKALSLDDTAGEAQILSAITTLQQAPDLKVLEAHAANHGKVLLDSTAVAELQQRAAAGDKAKTDLHEQRFIIAFDKAQFEGRVDARPETKTLHRGLFEADPELALQNLASLPRVVNVVAPGTPVTALEHESPAPDAPEGYDADSFQLHKKAEAYLAAHPDVDYLAAVEAVS
jgi:hypothetical protein